MTEPFNILVGVGVLYIAPEGEAFPALDAAPAGNWRSLGDTDGGVTLTLNETVEDHRVDQRTGKLKKTRSEEEAILETNLAEGTLENLADVLGVTVTDVPPGVGTIGTREIPLYRGGTVGMWAFLFRGDSPYGPYAAQFQVPRASLGGEIGLEFTKDGKTLIPVTLDVLEDLNAATPAERFGKLIVQDADALP